MYRNIKWSCSLCTCNVFEFNYNYFATKNLSKERENCILNDSTHFYLLIMHWSKPERGDRNLLFPQSVSVPVCISKCKHFVMQSVILVVSSVIWLYVVFAIHADWRTYILHKMYSTVVIFSHVEASFNHQGERTSLLFIRM